MYRITYKTIYNMLFTYDQVIIGQDRKYNKCMSRKRVDAYGLKLILIREKV